MNRNLFFVIVLIIVVGGVYFYIANQFGKSLTGDTAHNETGTVQTTLAAKFDYLSQNGNSSCSRTFKELVWPPFFRHCFSFRPVKI